VQGTDITECNCRAMAGQDEVASREFGGAKRGSTLGTKTKADEKVKKLKEPAFLLLSVRIVQDL